MIGSLLLGGLGRQRKANVALITKVISDNSGADYAAGAGDFELDAFEPTNNSAHNGTAFQVKGPGAFPDNGLIKFAGLSNIAGTVTVDPTSRLRLWLASENSVTATNITLRRVLRNWVETEVTWNIWSTGNNWTTAGCLSNSNDRVATASATVSVGNGTGQYWDFSSAALAQDIQDWINGVNSNYGWVLEGSVADEWKNFASRTGTNGQRPILEVKYT